MRPDSEFELVDQFIRWGLNDCQVARITGVNRRTVCDWRRKGRKGYESRRAARFASDRLCPRCGAADLNAKPYVYLLGLYLGDGCISAGPRGGFKLRITLDLKYQGIVNECILAMSEVHPSGRTGLTRKIGCVEVYSCWNHWPCLFPQHGPGRKHDRPIVLHPWQGELITTRPDRLLRGLIHSDGWRGLYRVNGKGYPRYEFANASADIREIFCRACDLYGVRWRRMKWNTISVARSADVAKLDQVIGPKA